MSVHVYTFIYFTTLINVIEQRSERGSEIDCSLDSGPSLQHDLTNVRIYNNIKKAILVQIS